MRTLAAVFAILALFTGMAEAHPYHRHYAPIRHIDAPANRGWIDAAALPAYPYPSQERQRGAVSRPSGHYSHRYAQRPSYYASTRVRHAAEYAEADLSLDVATLATHYYSSGGGLSGPCQQARREGGPCGCHTAEVLLHTSAHVYHGINVWLADGWLAFQQVANPQPGDAAIWVHRHVAPIVAVDGVTVTVEDYFGRRTVSKRGLIFVRPG